MVIDTHTHYNFPEIKDKWQEHWKKAQEKGVSGAVLVGTNIETSKEVLEMAQLDQNFYATVGVHPHDCDQLDIKKLEKLAKNNKVVGIGEIGLDYYWLDKKDPKTEQIIEKQKEVFISQLKLANKLNLPISLHIRDKNKQAYDDALAVIKEHRPVNNFVLHCVSGPVHYIEQMIELGAYFGFDGNVTYKNAENIREILRMVPKDKIVVETDAPYLPPVPYRGKVCEPWMVVVTTEYIKKEFKISRKTLLDNSKNLFLLNN